MMDEFYTTKYDGRIWLAYHSNKLPYDFLWGFTRLIRAVD